MNNRHLDVLDLTRAHAVVLCSRPPALASGSFLLRMPTAEIPREIKKTADRENFLQKKTNTDTKTLQVQKKLSYHRENSALAMQSAVTRLQLQL